MEKYCNSSNKRIGQAIYGMCRSIVSTIESNNRIHILVALPYWWRHIVLHALCTRGNLIVITHLLLKGTRIQHVVWLFAHDRLNDRISTAITQQEWWDGGIFRWDVHRRTTPPQKTTYSVYIPLDLIERETIFLIWLLWGGGGVGYRFVGVPFYVYYRIIEVNVDWPG